MRFSFSRQILKLVSLVIAVSVWFYVLYSGPIIVQKEIPLKFKVPREVAIANITPVQLILKVKGPRVFMRNLSFKDSEVLVDLYAYPYKKNRNLSVRFNASDIRVPLGIKVEKIIPASLNITLEKRIEKKVLVKLTLEGDVPAELKLIKSKISPSRVMIEGPIETMRRVPIVYTEPIDVGRLKNTGNIKVALLDPDPRVSIIDDREYFYQYTIRAKKENMIIENVKVRFLSSSHRFKSKVTKVNLAVLASEKAKQQIKVSDINIIADIPEKSEKGTKEIKLKAFLPEGVHLLRIIPDSIKIRIY